MITDDELDRIQEVAEAWHDTDPADVLALVAEVRLGRERMEVHDKAVRYANEQERRADALEADAEESDALRARMGRLLSDTAIALNGPEPELTSWSWHDLPQKAQAAMDALRRIAALEGFQTLDVAQGIAEEVL